MAQILDLGNVRGPQGPRGETGAQGTRGTDGATWLMGTVAPTNQGKTGDFYLNTSNFDVYSKATGSWVKTGNIKGATGAQGIQGPAGAKGATGATGPAGPKGDKGDTPNLSFRIDENGHLILTIS